MTDIGPGDLVVCVDAEDATDLLHEGTIYTVESVHQKGSRSECGCIWNTDGVYLYEVSSGLMCLHHNVEAGFKVCRFRPIRRPSIEVLRRAVKDVPDKVKA